jgi:ABC-type phosphate/phosphonate transport system substrate-binding protein
MQSHSISAFVLICFGVAALPAYGADPYLKDAITAPPKSSKTSFAPPISNTAHSDTATLVFTSAPRETALEGQQIYGPIATYLSKALGKQVTYRHPGTWGAYRSEMLKGSYDIVFDGPHLNSYRAERLNHNVLVKLPGRHEFVIIVRKDDKFTSISQMGGRTFCSHAPPNLGALILISQFDNPARQPAILPTDGWDKIYEGVSSGRCAGGILPMANLKKLDANESVRVIFKTPGLPNQAFSAGPRLTAQEQTKIAAALTAPEAAQATEKLRAAFKADELLSAHNAEYSGIANYLRNEWGYY